MSKAQVKTSSNSNTDSLSQIRTQITVSPSRKTNKELTGSGRYDSVKMDEDNKNEPALDDTHKLFKFARAGNTEEIRLLKQRNPLLDVNAADDGGDGGYASLDTALHYAAAGGHLETVDLLEKLGAKVEAKNKLGSTPLIVAAAFGQANIIQFLLDKKANRDAKNEIGNNSLHCAVYAGHMDAVNVLLNSYNEKAKALGIVNGVGMSCWDYATQTQNSQMRVYFEQIVNEYQATKDDRKDDAP